MKLRLDNYIIEKLGVQSRDKAKFYIMSGKVYINNQKATKAGTFVKDSDIVVLRNDEISYVSRGGFKLEKAINKFNINLSNLYCMDIGASTGGFTDCMLKNGAKKVYAIDVGYGQLAWSLRNDDRVVNFERTNFRNMQLDDISSKVDFVSIDVSFISLEIIFKNMIQFLKNDANCLALIKPQFEAGKEKVGKKGVIKDKNTHIEVINKVYDFANKYNLSVNNLDFSPIKGPKGNIEYLIYLSNKDVLSNDFSKYNIIDIVNLSHEALNE